ncbi:hypothetical protein LCGC14_1104280 [marine sediment metagenome]|uniref:Uncharacterized protein n=1 Tax=marine sediment metagenome TaxID=412755 RepID=A0A0F9PRV4_9ZZZZ
MTFKDAFVILVIIIAAIAFTEYWLDKYGY